MVGTGSDGSESWYLNVSPLKLLAEVAKVLVILFSIVLL
jgi:hypothetical protein